MEKITNFRQLGGIKTKDNATIRNDRLFRSAAPEEGSEQDKAMLKALNIELFIDFRGLQEKDLSVAEAFNKEFNRVDYTINAGDFFSPDQLTQIKTLDMKASSQIFLQLYEGFVTHYQNAYAHFIAHVNEGQNLLFHCTAGKDRTGFAAFLILSALNVNEDDILADFIHSNNQTQALFEGNITERAKKFGVDPELYKTFRLVHEQYLYAAINKINEHYGTVEKYLRTQLNANLDQIRAHYLS